jgi:hypothetical protein
MSQITSTVSHDLTTWSTEALVTRAEVLSSGLLDPESYAEATSQRFNDRLDHILHGCGEGELCAVDDYRAIDAELANR